ncbi:Retrovirus-related Pol polyprotein from transposon 17.6, partial [Mucuna pruriens]
MCDASNPMLGAVLGQQVDKHSHVIAYASQTLDLTQTNYTTNKKGAFVYYKFCSYLLGSKIVIFSDYAALNFLLKKSDAKPRLIWWMLLLQEFDIEIRDTKGAENLRRIDSIPIRDDFLYEQLLLQLEGIKPWFADICNFLVASTLSLEASKSYKEKLRAMLNITCISLTTRSSRYSSSITWHLEAAITNPIKQPRKY